MEYYHADGIYPKWSTFVKTISAPQGAKKKHFTTGQESARKDIERAFGVLQARFAILCQPARLFNVCYIKQIMKAYIILYNMIIEDERHEQDMLDFDYEQPDDNPPKPMSHDRPDMLVEFIHNHLRIQDKETHSQLQSNLIKHLWQVHGKS
jgi:hypothetical protein